MSEPTDLDVLTALHHPVRRRILELLTLEGPATVGTIAAGLGQQVGSVSHHLKTLERVGFAEPAPDLARDRRESWWRSVPRRVSWSVTDFAGSPGDLLVAEAAERSNLAHHADKVTSWLTEREGAGPGLVRRGVRDRAVGPCDPRGAARPLDPDERAAGGLGGRVPRGGRRGGRRRLTTYAGVRVRPRQPGAPVTRASDPTAPPPLRRDWRVHAWVAARGVSEVGDSVWLIALAWTAVHIAGPGHAGLLLGVGTLPRAALLLVGGVLADRLDTRRTVMAANAARVVVLVVGVVLLEEAPGHTYAVLMGVALAFGVAEALHDPAAGTVGRQMVRPEDLRPLVATFQTVSRLARLGGAPLGAALVAAYGIEVAMLVDAVSFAVIGGVYVLLRPRFPRALSTGETWRGDLVAGLSYVRRTREVRILLVAFAGLNLFVGPAIAVGLALRVAQAGWGAHTLGVLEAAVGAGAAAGALAAARYDAGRPALVGFLVLVVQGVGIAAFGFGGQWFVLGAAALVGATAGGASTYLSAVFLLTVAEDYLGRAQSLSTLTDDVLMPAAMAGFGLLAGATSVTAACLVAGAAMSLLCTWSATRMAGVRAPGRASVEVA